MRPRRGRIRKIPPCQNRKRLRSSVSCHLVGSYNCHWIFPQKLIRRHRYGSLRPVMQTPRDDPVDFPRPYHHCLGVESIATGAPTTHYNLPDTDNCKIRPCFTLRILSHLDPSPSFERKPALPTVTMVHTIAI